MYLIIDKEMMVLYVIALLDRRTPTIICYHNSVFIILEQDITFNSVTLRLHTNLVHIIRPSASEIPTSSSSVELPVFRLLFLDKIRISPAPIEITAPV